MGGDGNMTIIKEPFTRYHEEKKVDSFTVRLNEEERSTLEKCKQIIQQPKDSSCLKALAWIGAKVIHEEKTAMLLATIFKNKKNNKRNGISEFD